MSADRTVARLAPDDVRGEAKFIHTMTIAFDEYIAELIGEGDPEQALAKAGFTATAEALAGLVRRITGEALTIA